MEEFITQIQKQAKKNQIVLDEKQSKQFYEYMNLLLEWNEKINLTAITNQEDIILKHFVDCMTLLPYLKEKKKMIDVGTGAGFPGIPIKIVKPDMQITLLDSLNKRVKFLEEVTQTIGLKEIQAVHGRAEEFARKKGERESYDIATSRAVARLNVLLEYLMPFVKVGGKCICMKSNHIEEELEEAKKAIQVLGGEIEKIEELSLGNSDIIRKIIIIKKVKSTPKEFPRKAGTPSKSPIC